MAILALAVIVLAGCGATSDVDRPNDSNALGASGLVMSIDRLETRCAPASPSLVAHVRTSTPDSLIPRDMAPFPTGPLTVTGGELIRAPDADAGPGGYASIGSFAVSPFTLSADAPGHDVSVIPGSYVPASGPALCTMCDRSVSVMLHFDGPLGLPRSVGSAILHCWY